MLPFQLVPATQLAVADWFASSCALLYRKKFRPTNGTCTASGPPLFSVPTTVPATGHGDVTCEVATGFVVVHDIFTLQLLAPDGIVHVDVDSVSVPVMLGA